MGSLAFLVAIYVIVVYLFFGRLHRIAFQRKFRLIRKCIIMYGVFLTTADMINRAGNLLDKAVIFYKPHLLKAIHGCQPLEIMKKHPWVHRQTDW